MRQQFNPTQADIIAEVSIILGSKPTNYEINQIKWNKCIVDFEDNQNTILTSKNLNLLQERALQGIAANYNFELVESGMQEKA